MKTGHITLLTQRYAFAAQLRDDIGNPARLFHKQKYYISSYWKFPLARHLMKNGGLAV